LQNKGKSKNFKKFVRSVEHKKKPVQEVMMKRHNFFEVVAVFSYVILALLYSSAHGETFSGDKYYTWGISNDKLDVPSGSIVTEATLTIHNITSTTENKGDMLYIHLVDNPPLGYITNEGNTSGDNFQSHGAALEPIYHDQTTGTEKLIYTLGSINDPSSSVWQVFDYPFIFPLADSSTVSFSSSLLEFIDYAGTGTSFGFAFDPNGIDGYEFDGISLELTIQSFQGAPAQSVATFTYGNTNEPPILADIGNKIADEGTQLTFTVSAIDPDGDTLAYSAQNLPNGALFTDNTFTWTPTYEQAGTYQVTFIASDSQDTDSETITITVTGANRAPVLAGIGDKGINENQTLSFSISATDADNDTISYSAQNLPAGAVFADNTFTWTPTYEQAGTYQVTFIASDSQDTDSETITITVNGTNRAPVLTGIGDQYVDENTVLSFTVNANDQDNDTLTYSAQNLPAGAVFADRTFTWTPDYAQAGSYQVTFAVTDGELTDSQTITITVNNVNRYPVLANITNKSVVENNQLLFTISATDPDGDTLIYFAAALPAGAKFNNRTLTWTPAFDQAGRYYVTFIVSDGIAIDLQRITITVDNVNREPSLEAIGDKNIDEGSQLTFVVTATDPDGDTITYSAQNLPADANFIGQTFLWQPTNEMAGSYQVTFTASDSLSTVSETVTITVNNANAAPVLAPIGDRSVEENKELTFTISATDIDGDTIIYSMENLPSGAVFENNTFTWRTWYGQAGTYDLTFTASDTQLQDSKTITITVTAVQTAGWYKTWLSHLESNGQL
jgi:PKD repeat protein